MDIANQVLKDYFGYDSFREGQEAVIRAILGGRDAVGIMPTGAGKSLCYQVPALILEGITIVISPLVSLMKDQVGSLVQNGAAAAFLNSSLTGEQFRATMHRAYNGEYKMLYVAPERLFTPGFLEFASQADIAMVAVDEAHCVSHWGQDFRPDYLNITQFIAQLPRRPVVCAFTATATPRVRDDICTLLALCDPLVTFTGFDRKNLYFEVRRMEKTKDKRNYLLSLLSEMKGKSGIIYCATRKNVEKVYELLQENGYAVGCYHAGMTVNQRRENQDAFLYDTFPIIVATNAFGMGIDKSNVSFVIHYNMPQDLESYYQEAGRAGRDGEAARCILLYSGQDVITNRLLIEHSAGVSGGDHLDAQTREAVAQSSEQRLREMISYCFTTRCLRAHILRYFGEIPPDRCDNCFNCNHHFEEIDVTIPAQKILSCIKRTGERYGMNLLINILRGDETDRIVRLGLKSQTTYGLMADTSKERLREIFDFLDGNGYLYTYKENNFSIIRLGPRAGEVLYKRLPVTMHAVKEEIYEQQAHKKADRERRATRERSGARPSLSTAPPLAIQSAPELFESLRALRKKIASEQGVPPYYIFSDASLAEMCRELPTSPYDFLKIKGVGQKKLEAYGEKFLKVIFEYVQSSASSH